MTNANGSEKNNLQPIVYDKAFELVKYEVDRVLSASPSIIREYTRHLSLSVGKFIRARALLACAEDDDGLIHPNSINFAASIEILHLATLVHDDVIDNADLRRGKISLQKKYGKRTAVICGDYLLCMALRLAGSIPNKKDYLELSMQDYMSRVCLGELNQHINNDNYDLSVRQYLKIISGKTAALFEASFRAGAVLSEKEETVIQKYSRLGKYIGMIFQMMDDCMDFESTEKIAKKTVQSDYEQNVITLPLIHAIKNIAGFKERAKTKRLERLEINDAVEKAGGLTYTRGIAEKYYKKSIKMIDEIGAPENKRKHLMAILDKAYHLYS